MLFLGSMFLLGVQPILLMGMLVMLVFLYSLKLYMMSMSFWFGYIFMLVMLTGVLVLFSYMLSLIPNMEFEFSNIFFVVMFLLVSYFMDEDYYLHMDISDYSTYMWFSMMGVMTFFLIIFLFGMMVVVVWLSMMDMGSMRE